MVGERGDSVEIEFRSNTATAGEREGRIEREREGKGEREDGGGEEKKEEGDGVGRRSGRRL